MSDKPVISKSYNPKQVEKQIYQRWLDEGFLSPIIDASRKPFVIIQPPPNATGQLHLGHAQRATVEDTLVRWHRMKGDPTLWLPGIDHAGIATQVVVERELANEGLTRHDLGREKFLTRMWDWVEEYRGIIREQHRRIGASCDWTREQFTLDSGPAKAVRHTFINLFRKGLIYQGERITNWCTRCATALSDLEVEHQEVRSHLYYIKYKVATMHKYVTVATTRPETLLGDTGVAVNPKDPRYTEIIGEHLLVPLTDRLVPIVSDESVDPTFGTGALKVTPGHDQTDFEIGVRNHLPVKTVIGLDGRMAAESGHYAGMTREDCRNAVVADLDRVGLLERTDSHIHTIGHCHRCGEPVEPLVTKQWFVNVEPLAQPALEAVQTGAIKIVPAHFEKVYVNWLEIIKDWCISRQLWWGHRIPVWHCSSCGQHTTDYEDPTECSQCGSAEIDQDPDVLDTWFSSALWPHSTLGWPDTTEEFDYFYPTTVLETGYDILFFWVARMIMMGLENTGKVPFETVYLSGLIRDTEGNKMSKTKGNVIDPLETIESYGADALRFAITIGNAPGNDSRLGPTRLEAGRNFANKIWNASRFVLASLTVDADQENKLTEGPSTINLEDRWILSRLDQVTSKVNKSMHSFQLGEAEQAIYEFFWNDYCDWYIEAYKARGTQSITSPSRYVLAEVLETSLRLLHPFMPFITEELWGRLADRLPSKDSHHGSIMVAPYPESDSRNASEKDESDFAVVIGLVRMVRNTRAELKIPPTQNLDIHIVPGDSRLLLEDCTPIIKVLGKIGTVNLTASRKGLPIKETVTAVIGTITVSIPVKGFVDVAEESKRLIKELEETMNVAVNLNKRLIDEQFLSKAPEEVISREKERSQNLRDREIRLRDLISQLSK